MNRSAAVLSVIAALGLAHAASADILWDQSDLNTGPNSQGFFNAIVPGFNGAIVYAVNDVTVPASGWTVQSVTTYFTDLSFQGPLTSAVLNIFPKSGTLPLATEDPRASPTGDGTFLVTMDARFVDDFQGVIAVTASGLDIDLPAGEYWIGLTPVMTGGPFGADFGWAAATAIGDATASNDASFGAPSGWFNQNPGQDAAILVEGVAIPAPGAATLLALTGIGALGRRRR